MSRLTTTPWNNRWSSFAKKKWGCSRSKLEFVVINGNLDTEWWSLIRPLRFAIKRSPLASREREYIYIYSYERPRCTTSRTRYHRANVDKPEKIFADETNEPFVEINVANRARLRYCLPKPRLSSWSVLCAKSWDKFRRSWASLSGATD